MWVAQIRVIVNSNVENTFALPRIAMENLLFHKSDSKTEKLIRRRHLH